MLFEESYGLLEAQNSRGSEQIRRHTGFMKPKPRANKEKRRLKGFMKPKPRAAK
ncbi:hypothetical protein [Cytobacillus firmus]|uniref:hypothetical protein n=1 Tax=Cytobacillus firmus TaxID=1399 RepID=UPI001C8E6272|nr:hypothetical protein [Cytobacillus firmus]MBX9974870.1 hypothetical protein [Cytobacillus firmus]